MSKSTKAVCALAALLVLLVWSLWATATTQAEPGQKELETLLVKVGYFFILFPQFLSHTAV